MTGMRPVPRPVAVLFLLASAGVVLLFGLIVEAAFGRLGVLVYAVLLGAPVLAAAVASSRRRARRATGRTCTCCTGTVHDPVQVI